MRIIRRSLISGKESVVAGYSDTVPLAQAIEWLEQTAGTEAKESRCQLRSHDRKENGEMKYERILSLDGQDVESFYLQMERTCENK